MGNLHRQASLVEQQPDRVTGGVRSRDVATQTLHPGLHATSAAHRKAKRGSLCQCELLTRGERAEPQPPMALFWVLHLHPRDVAEVILALHNAGEGHHQGSGGGGRPLERGKGGKVAPALRPRGTGDEEAPQLLRGLGGEALMHDGDRKVQSTSEKMIPLLLLLLQSN